MADGGVAALGEISLTGKVRYVLQADKRVQELSRRGFGRIFLPARNAEELRAAGAELGAARLTAVTDIGEAVKNVGMRSERG